MKEIIVTSQTELKPCPFCGGEARIDRNIFAFPPSYSVICKICEAESEVFNTEKAAIEAWNRRCKVEQ